MEKEFVPYELSLELKQLGMDLGWYNYLNFYDSSTKEFCFVMKDVPAPLYQQAFRWFREKYQLRFFIQSGMSDLGEFFKVIFPDGEQRGMSYTTYEEAELECLKKLIEIVKTK
jgi:hypothetical protein